MFGRRGSFFPGAGRVSVAILCASRRRGRWMGNLFQVNHGSVGVELLEDVIRSRVPGELGHRPALVSGVAKGYRTRGTRSRARRRELVGFQRAPLRCGPILGLSDALHAEGALFHHTLSTHSDVGIELPVEGLGESVLRARGFAVAEPVEVANLVRAVVGAIPGSDAAIVDLHVQSVRSVISGVHRTNRLTR